MRRLNGLALLVFCGCPLLVHADTRSEMTLPGLIDRLLNLQPVVPSLLADAERATGMRFHEEFHGAREWDSDAVTLADGIRLEHVELRGYPPGDPRIRLINIVVAGEPCTSPASIISRYGLTSLAPPNPAPAPPAAGYAVPSGPVAYHMGQYRRMPWGLFAVGFDRYPPREGLPECMTGVTLRVIDANEEGMWP